LVTRVYASVCMLSLAAFLHYCTDPDVTWGMVVMHYWTDLESVHGFCCHDNIAPNAKCQRVLVLALCLVTFRLSPLRRRRREIYIGHERPCVCVCVCLCVCLSLAAFLHYCTDQNVTWRNGRGYPLVVQYWADLQPVHEICCHDNISPNAKCQ